MDLANQEVDFFKLKNWNVVWETLVVFDFAVVA